MDSGFCSRTAESRTRGYRFKRRVEKCQGDVMGSFCLQYGGYLDRAASGNSRGKYNDNV